MKTQIDKNRFGPWALVTGASSGIGKEFACQLAASGLNIVLVARREFLLQEVGQQIAKDFNVQYRTVVADLAHENFIKSIDDATNDLDVGLIVSNAGTASSGKFLSKDLSTLVPLLRLNTLAHLEIVHHFGPKLAERGRGGFLFVGAMGADKGIPYMANDSASKAYVQAFAEAIHVEFKPLGVYVTVLPVGPTDTPVLAHLGLSPDTMPMKPMKVDQCVSEGLKALQENRSMIIPGLMNRIMNAVVPAPIVRSMMAQMFEKASSSKTTAQQTQARVR